MKAIRSLIISLASFAALSLIAITFASPSALAQEPVATVSVETQPLGILIPKDFVGISLEVSTAGQGIGAFAPGGETTASAPPVAEYALGTPEKPNEAFFQFMRNLGPGVLRMGGNSQDNTCWDPAAAPHPDWCKAEISKADFALYSRAAKESGWRLIVGINLKQNSSEWALEEVTQALAPAIKPGETVGLEIGNEPDLFSRDGSRPKTYSPADHAKDFLAYRDAFAKNATARQYGIVGPATCCAWRNAQDLGVFIDGVGASNLNLISIHNYPLTTCNGRTVTVQQLLAPETITRFDGQMRSLAAAAHDRKLPIVLAETNSASCGGMPGVSNAFAAALWGMSTLYSAVEDGLSGVNFHISYRPGGSAYNAIDTYAAAGGSAQEVYKNVAEPLYYGMYLFAQNASGEYLLPANIQTNSNIRAYATMACSNCAVHVVLLNEDVTASGRVAVHLPNRKGTAQLLFLNAPKLSAPASDVRYGGGQFDQAGHIGVPQMQQVKADADGDYDFDLPNAAAAVLIVPGEGAR